MTKPKTWVIGCITHVYDAKDQLLTKAKVTSYNMTRNIIEIDCCLTAETGTPCRLVIAAKPVLVEFKGTVSIKTPASTVIALDSNRAITETRKEPRYLISKYVSIESLIIDERAYQLHHPLKVRVIDISKGGARILVNTDMMSVGDKLELRIAIGDKEEQLLAEVINAYSAADSDWTEYGCRFYGRGSAIKRRVSDEPKDFF